MTTTVAVVGGGYGGIEVAHALDDVASVVLIEPRDRFVHNVAALRAVVDPSWTERVFLPYDRLLVNGQVKRDRVTRIDEHAIVLAGGGRIAADYIVLATGSDYPFPAKLDVHDTASGAAKLHATRRALDRAAHVLLLGAGPVGLELAGEIKAAWPHKAVTIVDPADEILSGAYTANFRTELRRQLRLLDVRLILGTRLPQDPPTRPGDHGRFSATTTSGHHADADIWFRCFGVAPTSDYLSGALSTARRSDGHLEVTPELRLPGHEHIFAIGDLTAIAEAKTAKAAGLHARVVATNIQKLIHGATNLTSYQPAPPSISIPLGPDGGASYASDTGILDAETTSQLKGADLKIDAYRSLLGQPAPRPLERPQPRRRSSR